MGAGVLEHEAPAAQPGSRGGFGASLVDTQRPALPWLKATLPLFYAPQASESLPSLCVTGG